MCLFSQFQHGGNSGARFKVCPLVEIGAKFEPGGCRCLDYSLTTTAWSCMVKFIAEAEWILSSTHIDILTDGTQRAQ